MKLKDPNDAEAISNLCTETSWPHRKKNSEACKTLTFDILSWQSCENSQLRFVHPFLPQRKANIFFLSWQCFVHDIVCSLLCFIETEAHITQTNTKPENTVEHICPRAFCKLNLWVVSDQVASLGCRSLRAALHDADAVVKGTNLKEYIKCLSDEAASNKLIQMSPFVFVGTWCWETALATASPWSE